MRVELEDRGEPRIVMDWGRLDNMARYINTMTLKGLGVLIIWDTRLRFGVSEPGGGVLRTMNIEDFSQEDELFAMGRLEILSQSRRKKPRLSPRF